MESQSHPYTDCQRTHYLPQSAADGTACVIVSRPGAEPEVHPFHTKEEACFWARQWMRRDRIARLEGLVFGTAWIETRLDH